MQTLGHTPTLPRVEIPPVERATPQELERRRHIIEEIRRLRQEIGPIGIAADELIQQARLEDRE